MRILGLIISFLLFSQFARSQSLDSLTSLIPKIQKGENDSVRLESNKVFLTGFENLLKVKNSFTRNFDTLKNISIIVPDDDKFRLYTWVVPHYDGSKYEYFGFIQYRSAKEKDSVYLIPLHDSTSIIQKPESEKLSPNKWLGAVYYSIKSTEKSGTTYYTLFGWKGKNEAETQKLIEVLYFNKNKPQFGYPLFKTGSVFKSRMIFTFASQTTMKLNYDKNYGGIVFDHLAANKTSPALITGPDGTYDAFKWKKGKWLLYKDVDVRTKWQPTEQKPVSPEEK